MPRIPQNSGMLVTPDMLVRNEKENREALSLTSEKAKNTDKESKKIIKSTAETLKKLESWKEKLEDEKKEREKLGPSLKKQLNGLMQACVELDNEMDDYAEIGKDQAWVKREFPKLDQLLDKTIADAKKIATSNFALKHGGNKGEVYTLKSCENDIALIKKANSDLIETMQNVRDGHGSFEVWCKQLKSLKLLNNNCTRKLAVTEAAEFRKNKSNISYSEFFKSYQLDVKKYMRIINGQLEFFKQTNAMAKNSKGEASDKLAAEIKARVSQDIQSRQNASSESLESSGGILWNTLTAIGDTLSSIYSYFFG